MDNPTDRPLPIPLEREFLLKQKPQETAESLFDACRVSEISNVSLKGRNVQIGIRSVGYDHGPDGEEIRIWTGSHTVNILKRSGSSLEFSLDGQKLNLENPATEDETIAWNTLMNAVQTDLQRMRIDTKKGDEESVVNASRARAEKLLQM